MKFGSVCSGIEAASVAWHPLGWTAAWLSEIEPFPCAVLKHHYPDVPNHGDMTLLPEKILSGQVEAPDLFCGGTPCQAFSVAGLRNSLKDSRGNLSLTFVGIANAIDHVRSLRGESAGIIFWENVPGVLNTKDNAFGCFLGALAGESEPIIPSGEKWTNSGCVFGSQRTIAWRVLDAQYFGVAQRRRRVFVIASARKDFDPAKVLFEFEGLRRDIAPSRQAREDITQSSQRSSANSKWPADISSTLDTTFGSKQGLEDQHVNSGCPMFVPDIQPQIVGAIDCRIGAQRAQNAQAGHMLPIPIHDQATRHAVAYNIAPGKGELKDDIHVTDAHVSKTIDASGSNPAMHQGGAAIVQPIEVNGQTAWSMNLMSPGRQIREDDGVGALTQDAHRPTQGNEAVVIQQAMAVRRLTPVECERLQGFPDNYSNIPWRKAAESPDGPRYKALGNSWAVPVVAWIGKRIQDQLK